MSELENDLKNALRRQSPPDGFAEKVLTKIPVREARTAWWRRLVQLVQLPTIRWAVATGALVVLLAAGTWQIWRPSAPSDPKDIPIRGRLEGEQAKDQLMLALRITSAELREVHRRVAEAADSVSDDSRPARDAGQRPANRQNRQ